MNVDDIANYSWELVSIVGKGGSSTVYKAALHPLQPSIVHSSISATSVSSSATTPHTAGLPPTSPNTSLQSLTPKSPPLTATTTIASIHSPPVIAYVAVKEIDLDALNKTQLDSIQAEINNMKSLHYLNIVNYFGMQQRYNRIYIFMEYARYGSLRQFYQKYGKLNEYETYYCLKQILLGLQYLHSNGFAHRDIKCANCLLFDDGIVKLADFGASKKFESESIVSGLKGTPHWMAPEVIKGNQMTSGWIKADVWSVGCTVVEMITGKLPYCYYENPITAMYRIANGEIPKINYETKSSKSLKKDRHSNSNTNSTNHSPSQEKLPASTEVVNENEFIEISSELTSFIEVCCALEPSQRPTVSELLQHPFILKYSQREEANQEPPPPRLFTLQEEIMNVPILPSQSVTLNHHNQPYLDPNRMSQGSGGSGRGLPLHPITVDESVNLPGGIAHPTSATVNRKYLINTNMSYNSTTTTNPLTFESQATPALGLHRNFSTNFGDDVIGLMTTTESTSSLMLPPRSAVTTASTSGNLYMNYLAFSREGTANTNFQTYYPPPLTSTSNPATSQRNTATRPNRFSDSYTGQSEEFDLIKQTKIGDLIPSTTYELDEVGTTTNVFELSRDLREDHSRGVLLAPIKSMDPDDYMEEEFEPKVHYIRRHNTNDLSSNNNNYDDDQVIDEVKDQHYRDDFEKEEIQEVEEEEEIFGEVIEQQKKKQVAASSSSIKQPGINVSYRYKSNQDFRDSFDESYDSQANNGNSSCSSSKKMTSLNADGLVKPNLTPVKIQSKGSLLQASLKKKELENFVVERPTAPLTSEKLVLTETGELSPLKESHLMRLNSSDIMDVATSSSTVIHTSHPNTLIGPLFTEDALTNSSKKMHKMSDYVQASPSNKTLKNSLLGLHDGSDTSQLMTTVVEAESGHSSSNNGNTTTIVQSTPAEIAVTQAHDDILKVSRLKVGSKFIHHPPSSVQQQSLLHQRHRIHHQPSNDSNQPPKTKLAGQKGHKRSSTEKLSSITPLLSENATTTTTTTTMTQTNNNNTQHNPPMKNMHIQNHLTNSHSRSLSAGATLVSSHSNSNLLGKKGGKGGGGKNGKKTKPNPNTKLPPLEKKKGSETQQDDMEEEEEELGKRYVQSAPAVSRSVNLPPIQRTGPVQLTGNTPADSSNHQNNNQSNHHQNVLTSITPKATSRKFMYPENIPANQQPLLQPQPPNNTLTSLKGGVGGVNKLLDTNKKTSSLLGNSGNYSARLQAVPEISQNNQNKSNKK